MWVGLQCCLVLPTYIANLDHSALIWPYLLFLLLLLLLLHFNLQELGVNCLELMLGQEFNELEYFNYNSVPGEQVCKLALREEQFRIESFSCTLILDLILDFNSSSFIVCCCDFICYHISLQTLSHVLHKYW